MNKRRLMGRRGRFEKTVFDNGLTLLTERHPEFRSLSIGVWVRAGTRHEGAREAGISHFLEHMVFKGTERRTALDIAREIDQVGGEFNAFTAREYTCFYLLLLDRDMALGIDVLADVLLNSKFSPEEIERERKVILQEIAMVEESPEELIHDLYFEWLYGRHALGRPILGNMSSVRRMSRVDLLRYFRKHYHPSQLIISVAGNIEHRAVARKVRGLLGKPVWPGRKSSGEKVFLGRVDPAPPLRTGQWWIERDTEQMHIVWGVEGPRQTSPERFAAALLNTHLGGGMSSMLFQEIREKNGLAYTVYSSLSQHRDSGVFTIYAATGMNQLPLCLKLIDQCVEKLRTTLMTDEELQSIKDNVKGTILLSADSVESRMSTLAKNEMYFETPSSVDEVCRQIDLVTSADIRRLARKYLKLDRRSLFVLGPKPPRTLLTKLQPVRFQPYYRT